MKPVWVAERNVFIRDISNHKLRLFPALLYFHEMRLTVTRQLIMTILPSLKWREIKEKLWVWAPWKQAPWWRSAHSLWLSRKKGESESSSGSGEERGWAKVCSAPVRKGGEARKERKVRGGKVEKRNNNSTSWCRDHNMWNVSEERRESTELRSSV